MANLIHNNLKLFLAWLNKKELTYKLTIEGTEKNPDKASILLEFEK